MIDNLVLSRAKAAVLARDFSTAARIFKNLIKENPSDVPLLTQLGNMYVKAGHDDKALPVFNQILELDADNLGAMNNLGAIYRRRKEYGKSEEILLRARKVGGGNTQVEYNLGFTYKIMGEHEKAIKCFEDVISANPSDVLAYNHIGAIYAARGEHENAVQSYLRGLKIDPNHPVLHLNIAKSYEKLHKSNEAVLEYENALRAKPGWLEAIDGYADLLMEKRRSKDAGAVLMQAIRLSPENEKMHTKLGNIFEHQGDHESAQEAYSAALEIKSDYAPALSGLASAYEKTGNFPAALQTMEKLESIKPGDVLRQYSGILLSAKEIDEAKKKIDTLLEMAADDPHALNLLGQYDICIGDFDSAKQCFDKIEQLNPSYKEYLKDGAKRMKQQGIFDEAESLEKEYLAEHPEDPEALTFLAELYEEQNKMQDALEMYKRSLDADSGITSAENALKRLEKTASAENAPIFDSIEDLEKMPSTESEDVEEISDEEISQDGNAIEENPENNGEEKSANEENLAETEKSNADEIAETEEVPSLSTLAEDSGDDIFSVLDSEESAEEDSESEEQSAPDENAVATESMQVVSEIAAEAPMTHNIHNDVEKSIDEIVPLEDVTDYDFSEIQKHDEQSEDFSWPLEADPVKDFTPPPIISAINTAGIQEALKNAIPQSAPVVINVNAPNPAEDIDSSWDGEPQPALQASEDDFGSEDLSDAVDFTEDFEELSAALDAKKGVSEAKVSSMLEQMKKLFDSLPEQKKQEFLESRPRMVMEYVLSKLQKKTGLLQRAIILRKKLGLSEASDENKLVARNDVKNMMIFMNSLAGSLSDTNLASAIKSETDKILSKL